MFKKSIKNLNLTSKYLSESIEETLPEWVIQIPIQALWQPSLGDLSENTTPIHLE